MGRPFDRALNAQSLTLTNAGHLSAPKANRPGLGWPWNAKRAGLLVLPVAIVPLNHVARCGSRSRLTSAHARSGRAITGSPSRTDGPANGIVRSAKKRVKRPISSALITPYANAAPIWCGERCHSEKSNTGMKPASGCLLITTPVNWSAPAVSHQFRHDHYPFVDLFFLRGRSNNYDRRCASVSSISCPSWRNVHW